MQWDLLTPFTSTWTDYDGESPYGDYTVSGSTVTNGSRYEPGVWNTEGSSAQYLHSDHLGTLRMTTTASGAAGTHRIFTAFGERITGPTTPDRHGYVGEYGYQTHADFPLLHIGARYYDPASGRFLQRDPIGILGGTNVYAYVDATPTKAIDPSGLTSLIRGDAVIAAVEGEMAIGGSATVVVGGKTIEVVGSKIINGGIEFILKNGETWKVMNSDRIRAKLRASNKMIQ